MSTTFLHYADDTVDNRILDVYQEMAGAESASDRWLRWRVIEDSGNLYTVHQASSGQISVLALETDRDDWTLEDGAGDAGSWSDYSIGSIVAKRRDAGDGYTQYSAYATYTYDGEDDITDVYLGVHLNATVNGVIRIKINDIVSTTGLDLDANGEYDEADHGTDNSDPAWIHIATDISTGDVIKIEAKGATEKRHVITGLRFYSDCAIGDAGWEYRKSGVIEESNATQFIAMNGYVSAQSPAWMFGLGHGHERSAAISSITLDETSYTIDVDLVLDDVISCSALIVIATSVGYGDVAIVDDFCILTRRMEFEDNVHTQTWTLDFTADYHISTLYCSMFPADYSASAIFRYLQFGDHFITLLPNDGGNFPVATSAASPTGKLVFFGGTANLRLTVETDTPLEDEFITTNGQKGYFFADSTAGYYGDKVSGNSLTSVATFTIEYEEPSDVDWSGKTLFVPEDMIIDSATELLPFGSNNIYVKAIAGAGLTFDGVAPTRTYFTSQHDNKVGTEERNSTGSPAKSDWDGITVSGSVNGVNNIVCYATVGITLSSNANAYHNSLNQNTTGISAPSGSAVKNNALINQTTYSTGAGTFDYNGYPGNTETNGVDGDPLFSNALNGAFSLESNSPCIDEGDWLEVVNDYAGRQREGVPDIGAWESVSIRRRTRARYHNV